MKSDTKSTFRLVGQRGTERVINRLVQIRSRGRLLVPKEGRRAISWLVEGEQIAVVLELEEKGRIRVFPESRIAKAIDDAADSIRTSRYQLEEDPEEDAADLSPDDLLLELSFRYQNSIIENSGRMTLEREALVHLGFEDEELGEVFVIARDDVIEIWSMRYYTNFRHRYRRSVRIDGYLT